MLEELRQVRADVLGGAPRPDRLERVRFRVYQQASCAWGDPWFVARVADFEELVAEAAVQHNDFETAWRAWRGAWWVRHVVESAEAAATATSAHHAARARREAVMVALQAASGRAG